MDEAAAIRLELGDAEPLHFSLSGGEVFLDFEQLLEVAAHGKQLGGTVSCVTNAYWATSDERARAMIRALKQAGLTQLAASTSRFHQRYVKLERVRRALLLAKEAGLRTCLKCAQTVSDKQDGWAEAFAKSVAPDETEIFPIVPPLRDGGVLPDHEFIREKGLPKGRCPIPVITVREDGKAYTCCTPGGFVPFLELGNVHDTGLAEIRERYYLGGKQQLLFKKGPIHFARRAIAQGQGHLLRDAYAGICDLCAHIATDPQLSALAEAEGEAHERRQMRKLFGDVMAGVA
jgi:MoaA/NifB/PqqE/SkfB family radical SAM enzyme